MNDDYTIGSVLASSETHVLVAVSETQAEWRERDVPQWPQEPDE